PHALDEHLIASLRSWVNEERDEACRDRLVQGVQRFLSNATTEEIRAIYDFARTVVDDSRPNGQERPKPEADYQARFDLITLILQRKEVAAVVLYQLECADFSELSSSDPPTDYHVWLWRHNYFARAKELDPHLTENLREWVKTRRTESWRR